MFLKYLCHVSQDGVKTKQRMISSRKVVKEKVLEYSHLFLIKTYLNFSLFAMLGIPNIGTFEKPQTNRSNFELSIVLD